MICTASKLSGNSIPVLPPRVLGCLLQFVKYIRHSHSLFLFGSPLQFKLSPAASADSNYSLLRLQTCLVIIITLGY